jgi:alanyl-tRNA synthetase
MAVPPDGKTKRLYLHDAYRREFEGRVLAVRPGPAGAMLELDRTAFYPTAGGQLHDTGVLANHPVLEVVEDDGAILHRVALDAGALQGLVGECVAGIIDWERRFDHMQQHTGQHLLSQAALRVLQGATLAVHLGAERSTVDLALAAFGPNEADRLEDAANAVVMENRPVRTHFVAEAEIERLGLRRPPKKSGTIRIVEIADFDRSACGGTHVRATGEIGTIVITTWERYKGGTRLEFLCGWRALRDHRRKSRGLAEVGRVLSAAEGEVVEAVGRLAAREREVSRRAEETRQRLLVVEADLRRRSLTPPAVLAEVAHGRTATEVRDLARALVAGGGLIVLLAAADGRVVFARSPDLPVDVAALLRRVTAQFGGAGGGRAEFAQGTLAGEASPAEILGMARRWAEEELRGA